jgi:hypothetical protein
MKPSTGATVRNHRNAVRLRPESVSAFKWNHCPQSPESAIKERGKGKRAVWTRIGAAWTQEKGQGLNIELEALPLNFDGKIVLMPPKSEAPAADSFEDQAE